MTLYRATRNLYQRLFNRSYWQHRQAMKELYRGFVPPESLVFDIGANRGEVSEAFLGLGARVIAVEPNPALAEQIERHYGRDVQVEAAAVGARPGQAELTLGRDSGHSTLSQEWLEKAPTADRWSGTVTTEVTTLDALIDKHGQPAFVKIDVEAYEAEVLAGLSVPIAALCFEYQGGYPKIAHRCLDLLGTDYEYAFTKGEEPLLVTPWMDVSGARTWVGSVASDEYGDIFARRL